jgi:hypothetical protein
MASNASEGFALEAVDKPSTSIRLNASLTWRDVQDDFTLRYKGHVVGRIRPAGDASSADSLWEWQITVPMEMPEWARGSAGSREECFMAFAIALGRFLVETGPERLDRAWDLERAPMRGGSTGKLPANSAATSVDARPKKTIPPSRKDALAAIVRALSKLTKDNLI